MKRALFLAAALVLAGCERPPSETDMLRALERLQEVWAEQQRNERANQQTPLPMRGRPDLAFEAGLQLRIREVRRVGCREAPEIQGWLCTIAVTAVGSSGEPVTRMLQARFINGLYGWVVRDVRPIEVAPPPQR